MFHSHKAAHGQEACTCSAVRMSNGWCAACQVGYVASVPIKSADLFDAIDAHGHDYKPETIECESCRAAIASFSGGGFCDRSGLGFANGQLYCSHLSYTLARGKLRDPASIECATCRENSTGCAWCTRCGVGMVGNVAFTNRAFFDAAVMEYQRLQVALGMLGECELCAVVMFTRGECPDHERR